MSSAARKTGTISSLSQTVSQRGRVTASPMSARLRTRINRIGLLGIHMGALLAFLPSLFHWSSGFSTTEQSLRRGVTSSGELRCCTFVARSLRTVRKTLTV